MSVIENQLQVEVLQPEISGTIQRTTTEELKNWIVDGKLKPHHQVRVRNLSWVEAKNIPAFKGLFESAKENAESNSDTFFSQPISDNSSLSSDTSDSPDSSAQKSEFKFSETLMEFINGEKSPDIDKSKIVKSKIAEPSAAYKLFKQKAAARSKQAGAKTELDADPSKAPTKPSRFSPQQTKKSRFIQNTAVFLGGVLLLFLLSYGGSYLWVYQLKSPAAIDEKNIPEVWSLGDKLTTEKLELRLKIAEKERELKNASEPGAAVKPLDINQEIAKLEKQFDGERKNLIEKHREKLQTADFNNTFYFSFAVLLGLFFIGRVFYGKSAEPERKSTRLSASEVEEIDAEESLELNETGDKQERSEKNETEKPAQNAELKHSESVEKTVISDSRSGESSSDSETAGEKAQTIVKIVATESRKVTKCLLHQDRSSNFVCGKCDNFFCSECVIVIEEQENCCPFCKTVCNQVVYGIGETDSSSSEAGAINSKSETAEKKKPNLLDLGTNENFVVRDFPERSYRVGVLPGFLIALFFSFSISVFWVYKISPYLEERAQAANQTEVKKDNPVKTAQQPTSNSAQSSAEKPAANTANEPCIDPISKQPFQCDEETRRALADHTAKVQSVEKAQKDTAEKTNLILSPFTGSDKPNEANQPPPDAAELARKEADKQQFIKIFLSSFVIIFGLLMSTRLIPSNKESEPEE